jgi:exosome complex exonuclease DIS3/RRP44
LGIEGVVMFKKDYEFDAENYCITLPAADSAPAVSSSKAKGKESAKSKAKESVKVEGKVEKISVFDKVRVRIKVETDKNTQRGKVVMELVDIVG